MVNKPLIRPYSWGGVALGGVARIPLSLYELDFCCSHEIRIGEPNANQPVQE